MGITLDSWSRLLCSFRSCKYFDQGKAWPLNVLLCCLVEAFESQLQGLLLLRITVGRFSLNGPRKKKNKKERKIMKNHTFILHLYYLFRRFLFQCLRLVKHSVDPVREQKYVFRQLCKGKGLFTLYITEVPTLKFSAIISGYPFSLMQYSPNFCNIPLAKEGNVSPTSMVFLARSFVVFLMYLGLFVTFRAS